MPYNNNGFSPQPSNNLWVGDNYSAGAYRNQNNDASFNNFNQNMMQQMQPQPQRMNNVLQVMGPESAQAYQIGPDSSVILMDSNRPVFYMKRSDSSGYSETKAYEFHEIPFMDNTVQILDNEYVTKNEFEDFKTMIEDLVMKHE